jgi:hypothetical protein
MDLRGVTAAENPTLYYWQWYALGDSQDLFRVEISVEDPAQTASQRGLMPGWSAWTAQNPLPYTNMGGSTDTRVGWQRQMVLLNSFVGKRIKVRWVVNTMNPSGQADGWYIDSISFAYNLVGGGRNTPIPLPFIDRAQGLGNWIAEGSWGLTGQYFRPDAAQAALDASLWEGYWFNETDSTGSEQWWNFRGMVQTMQRLWPRPAANSNVIPNIGSTGPIRDTPTATINTLLDIWTPAESPLDGALGTPYRESVGGRFMRVVDLQPGTYVFNVSHDDGMSIWINDRTDTSVTNTNNYIYDRDNWDPRTTLRQVFFTVNQPMQRVIGVDFYQGWGQGHIFVSFGREAYSFHDSPNTLALGSYITVNALRPSVTSLISNGYFDLSTLSNPVVDFFWVGDLRNNMTIRLQFSSDGGFTWTNLWSDGNWRNFTPTWTQQVIAFKSNATFNGLSAAAKSRIMLRFALTNTGANRDGFYVGEVAVYNG